MAYKNKQDQQKAWREHYARNATSYVDRKRGKRAEIRVWMDSLKAGIPCIQCNHVFPPKAMDWHHRDPSTKEFVIANAAIKGYGKQRILAEVAKCDLLCAVCHRLIEE